MEPSQLMEEKPREKQQHVGRGDKYKWKAHTTPTHSVPTKVVIPLPPSAPMPQKIKTMLICTLMILH